MGAEPLRTRARFARMLRSFSRSEAGPRARRLFAGLIGLLLAINTLNVVNSYVGRDFMTALEQRHVGPFVRLAALYLGVFACATVTEVILRWTEESLALHWREWLARWTVRHYLQPPVYYRLGAVPNPDERIADDVRAFTSTSISLLLLFLNGTFTIVAFSGVLWSISPPLFVVAILYAAAGSLLAVAWGRPLVRLQEAQFDQEANFRADLIHVREHAEAVAVARREKRLLKSLLARIDGWAANFRRIVRVNRNLGFFVTGYRYLIQILPTLIVAPLFIGGDVPFGVVTQSAMAFAQLTGAFSLVINQFQPISSYAAVVQRLGLLDESIERAQSTPSPVEIVHAAGLGFDRLTLQSDDRVLTKELSGTVAEGARLLVAGPNDEAKTALFRAAAGTWPRGSGRVLRPYGRLVFLAERPYLPPGTLREALSRNGPLPDDRAQAALRDVGLEAAVARVGGLDVPRRWEGVLSLGEQQLAAAAYARLSSPRAVFLERPGSTLDPGQLRRILELFEKDKVAVVLIGRREEAPGYFTSELTLSEDGSWTWL